MYVIKKGNRYLGREDMYGHWWHSSIYATIFNTIEEAKKEKINLLYDVCIVDLEHEEKLQANRI